MILVRQDVKPGGITSPRYAGMILAKARTESDLGASPRYAGMILHLMA